MLLPAGRIIPCWDRPRRRCTTSDAADDNSDGWAYWPKPARAAAKLMELIEGDGTSEYRYGQREDATQRELKAAYRPMKSFRTRIGLDFDIVETFQTTLDI